MSREFPITAPIVVIPPATGVLLTLATGLSRGGKARVIAPFGCALGIIPHMTAAIRARVIARPNGLARMRRRFAAAFAMLGARRVLAEH